MDIVGRVLPTGETVMREVGRGATARVYLVSDGAAVRALKLFPVGKEARADHEHRVAHGLMHPHVGHVDARLDLDAGPALLMPFVSGRRLLARGRSLPELVAYLAAFSDLLDALAYLRRQGVAHRDVKPENVLVDRHGRARLIDFDLAVRVDDHGDAPAFAGTAAYLSPEVRAGAPATGASDLYAAGVLLYVALTGEAPTPPAPWPPSRHDPALAAADTWALGLLAGPPDERLAAAAAAPARISGLLAAWGEGAAS